MSAPDINVTFSLNAVSVEFPGAVIGPQGEQGEPGEAGPTQITCDDDDTVHAIVCVKVDGVYVLTVEQSPIP